MLNFFPLIEIVVLLSRLLGNVGTGSGCEQTILRPGPFFAFFVTSATPSISAVVLLVRNKLRFCDIF